MSTLCALEVVSSELTDHALERGVGGQGIPRYEQFVKIVGQPIVILQLAVGLQF